MGRSGSTCTWRLPRIGDESGSRSDTHRRPETCAEFIPPRISTAEIRSRFATGFGHTQDLRLIRTAWSLRSIWIGYDRFLLHRRASAVTLWGQTGSGSSRLANRTGGTRDRAWVYPQICKHAEWFRLPPGPQFGLLRECYRGSRRYGDAIPIVGLCLLPIAAFGIQVEGAWCDRGCKNVPSTRAKNQTR